MKILMTTDAVGGVWTYALDLAKALEPHGVEIALATMGPRPSDAQRAEAAAHANVTALHESDYKLEWQDDPWADVTAAGRWLLQLEERVRPDVVHLNGYAHGALPFHAPVVVAAHSCVMSWWRAVKGEAAPPAWDRYRAEVAAGLAGADVVIAPTAAMLATLAENYPVSLPRTRVIHNGRDAALLQPRRKEPFILAAGRLWDEAKNIAALEAVAGDVAWPIRVAGDGRAVRNGVVALGKLAPAELAGWLGRAEIYALPARYEPFGLSALEAALSGCALVLGDIPTLREVWGDAAVFVAPNDHAALRGRLSELIDNTPRRQRLARAARAHAARYSLSRMGDGHAEVYRAILRRRRAIDAAVIQGIPAAATAPAAWQVGA